MATKQSILTEITRIFAELGKELGFSEPVEQDFGYQTDLYMLRNGHALHMEILWGGLVVFVNVVRLFDGKIPDDYVDYENPDGTWGKESVYTIYHTQPVRVRHNNKHLPKTWDEMEPYYYRSLKALDLIRENPDVLLKFMDSIDDPPAPKPKKIGRFLAKD